MDLRIKEKIDNYICLANNKIAELSSLASDRLDETGCNCDITDYNDSILDINSSLYVLNKSWELIEDFHGHENYLSELYPQDVEDEILSIIDKYIVRYDMRDSSIIVYPGYNDVIISDPCCGGGGSGGGISIPPGGGPGFYLTKNISGDLIWKRLDDCLFSQTFFTKPMSESVAPYEFKLRKEAGSIYQIFINGQLLVDERFYEHDKDIVIIKSPIVLDSAVVKIFAACSSTSIEESSENVYHDNFTYSEGDPYIFELNYRVLDVIGLFINGLNYIEFAEYSKGSYTVSVSNEIGELEDLDDITISYTSIEDNPELDPVTDLFDTSQFN